jgi:hypothetical protein
MPFQLAAARLGVAAFGLGALTATCAVAMVRLDRISYNTGYQVMIAATFLGLVALGGALAWLLCAFRHNRGEGKPLGLIALFGSLLLLYPPLSTFKHRLTSPPLYDVTTDTEHPPAFIALLKTRDAASNSPSYDGTSLVSYQGELRGIDYVLHKEYPDITKPHAGFFPGAAHPVEARFWRALEAAKAMGWTIVDSNEAEGRIEATDTSFWFGRVCDIVIRVRQAGTDTARGVRIDIRAQSRDDQSDGDDNAVRIRRFFRLLAG